MLNLIGNITGIRKKLCLLIFNFFKRYIVANFEVRNLCTENDIPKWVILHTIN